MSVWKELIAEERAAEVEFEKAQREIKKAMQGRMCPSRESIVRRLTDETKKHYRTAPISFPPSGMEGGDNGERGID